MAARLTAFVVVAIVAVTLIAGLIVGAQRDDSDGPVDVIVHNAQVYTADGAGRTAEAVAIRGNQILRVGTDREISRLKRPQTTMIDAKGATVLPGFNDARVDFVDGGAAMDRIDLLDVSDLEDLEHRVREWTTANPDQPWVLGRGWQRQLFADERPTRQLLDRLVPDRPARLLSADGRTAWVNTKALRLAKITRTTVAPAQGAIVHEARSGEPSGLLDGSAIALVDHLLPALTEGDRDRALRTAIATAHRHGVTSVQDVADSPEELAAYASARRSGDLQVRVYATMLVVSDLADAELDALEVTTRKFPDDPLLKAGAVSVPLDPGPAATVTANGPAAGAFRFDADTLNRLIRRLDARGWQILTDAATELSARMTVDAYEHAIRSNPDRAGERRHRVEHLDAISDDDLARVGSLRLLVSLRPFDALTTTGLSTLARRLLDAKARLVLGSGWPSAPLDPLAALSAIAGPSATDADEDAARLSLKAAIDAFTSGAAWASFDEQRKGTIAPGMLADLVILSDDVLTTPAKLQGAHVEVTIFDGKVVFRRSERATN
ncbi:MAG: amidohydrolase [Vicinamibacterales bacterium]